MGILTAAEIIQKGVELGGVAYDAADQRPFTWLKDWLRSVALGWPWPAISTIIVIPVAAGAVGFAIGGTAPYGTGLKIFRVTFPITLFFGVGFLEQSITQQAFVPDARSAAFIPTGVPDKASYLCNALHPGNTVIFLNRKTKADYTFQVSVQYDVAADYDFSQVDTLIPWYDNDLTMKQVIAYETAKYNDGPDAASTTTLRDDLAIMLRNDKLKFGVIDSFDVALKRNWKKR